ncbi:MAG: flagellin FliC [Bdellovibrionales bacterium]|nr:flagellin FliC [Bdellovibrionales bacterium]
MGLRIATNVQALNSQRNLGISNERQALSLAKMASGARITKSGDDAAGLSISEKLRASIRGLQQANRNANDGISLVQVAEGGINEVSNMLIRMRELSVQAASDTIGDLERSFTDKEFQHLKQEIDRVANVTVFNGRTLLDGTGGSLEIQVGINNVPEEDRLVYSAGETDVTSGTLGIASTSLESKQTSQENLRAIDDAIQRVNQNRAGLGALQNRLQSTINNLGIAVENYSAANSRIRDVDVASETSELTKQKILTEAGVAVLGQANSSQMQALKLL